MAVEKGRIIRIGTNVESKAWELGQETRFHGLQTAVHAIGDEAIKMAVKAIEKALGDSAVNPMRRNKNHS